MLQKLYESFEGFIDKVKPQPLTVTVDGEHYKVNPTEDGLAVGDHIRKPGPIAKPTLVLQTLTGFADVYACGIDGFGDGKVMVHVVDPMTVALKSLEADAFGRRHEFARTVCGEKNPFPFGEYQVPQSFLINLQSGFLPTEDVISLQKLASSLTSESSIGVQDDGISQTITVMQSAASRQSVPLPPRLKLFAYRTFREIDPVESEFIVRIQGEPGKLPKIGLLEVDAGKWKLAAMNLVAEWLKKKIYGAIVIA